MHNDNTALRVASGPNNDDTKWMEVVLKNAGPMMDAISLHYYTVWHGDWAQRNEAMATGFKPATGTRSSIRPGAWTVSCATMRR
jgi:alpha-N-arabinofuranosidase